MEREHGMCPQSVPTPPTQPHRSRARPAGWMPATCLLVAWSIHNQRRLSLGTLLARGVVALAVGAAAGGACLAARVVRRPALVTPRADGASTVELAPRGSLHWRWRRWRRLCWLRRRLCRLRQRLLRRGLLRRWVPLLLLLLLLLLHWHERRQRHVRCRQWCVRRRGHMPRRIR